MFPYPKSCTCASCALADALTSTIEAVVLRGWQMRCTGASGCRHESWGDEEVRVRGRENNKIY